MPESHISTTTPPKLKEINQEMLKEKKIIENILKVRIYIFVGPLLFSKWVVRKIVHPPLNLFSITRKVTLSDVLYPLNFFHNVLPSLISWFLPISNQLASLCEPPSPQQW